MMLMMMMLMLLLCCSYLRQVLNETLRWAVISPYTGRVQEVDTVLDGHVIPAGVSSCDMMFTSTSAFRQCRSSLIETRVIRGENVKIDNFAESEWRSE